MNVDDLPHFFIRCLKVKEFWLHWFHWWECLSGIVIRNNQVIEQYVLFGFPSNSDVMQVLKFCILYAKYYIYIQRLFINNTLDLYTCLNQLKQAMKTEENICKTNNKKEKFLKYYFIYKNLQSNNEDIICNYVSKTMYILPKIRRVFKISKHKKVGR